MLGEAREQDVPPWVADRFRRIRQQSPTLPHRLVVWYSFRNSTTSRHRMLKSGSLATKAASLAMLIGWYSTLTE